MAAFKDYLPAMARVKCGLVRASRAHRDVIQTLCNSRHCWHTSAEAISIRTGTLRPAAAHCCTAHQPTHTLLTCWCHSVLRVTHSAVSTTQMSMRVSIGASVEHCQCSGSKNHHKTLPRASHPAVGTETISRIIHQPCLATWTTGVTFSVQARQTAGTRLFALVLVAQGPTLARCVCALRSALQVLGLCPLSGTTKSATTPRCAATLTARLRPTTATQQLLHTAVATCCTSCGPWGTPTGTTPPVHAAKQAKLTAPSASTTMVQKQRVRAATSAMREASNAYACRCTLQDQTQTVVGIVQLATPLLAHSCGRATGAAVMLGTRLRAAL